MNENTSKKDAVAKRLSTILKIYWRSLIAAPVLWIIGCMIIPFVNGQNLAGVLVIFGFFVILAAQLLAALVIAFYLLTERKSLTGKQVKQGLLPVFVQLGLLAAFMLLLGMG